MDSRAAEALIASLGQAHGVVTWRQVSDAGLSRRIVEHHEADGRLVRLGRGVWRLRDHPFDLPSRRAAVLALAGPTAVLGLRSAARMHGCWAYRNRDDVEVIIARGRDHRSQLGRVVQTRWLPDSHVTTADGIPITTLARTFFDLCGDPDAGLSLRHPVHERRMRQLYNDCLGRRGMTFTMAVAVLSVLARRGRSGTRLTRQILRSYGPRHEPTRSDVETLFFELVRSGELPLPEPQARIVGPDGFVATVDFAWRRASLIVEIDSSWHDGPIDRDEDARRDRRLESAGFRVLRYRFGEIALHPERVLGELGAVVHAMGATAAPRTRR